MCGERVPRLGTPKTTSLWFTVYVLCDTLLELTERYGFIC